MELYQHVNGSLWFHLGWAQPFEGKLFDRPMAVMRNNALDSYHLKLFPAEEFHRVFRRIHSQSDVIHI